MMKKAKYAALNAQILVSDPNAQVEVPQWTTNPPVRLLWTDTCIVVGCLIDADGETEFTLGDMDEVDPGRPPAYEGKLKPPTRTLSLESVNGITVLGTRLGREETMVRIWTNHDKEPDEVIVGYE